MAKEVNKIKNGLLVEEKKTYKFTASSPVIKLENAELIALWESTPPISSKNPNIFRLDPAEAIIKLSDFNKKTPHGWIAQPIDLENTPVNIDVNHLIAIHWMNGESRIKSSKKDSGSFTAVVARVADTLSDDNMTKTKVIQNKSLTKQNPSPIWSKDVKKGFRVK